MKKNITLCHKIFLTICICLYCQYLFAQNGTIDSSFGVNGKVIMNVSAQGFQYSFSHASAIGIQSTGKIIITVRFNSPSDSFVVMRIHKNGAIDSSFGKNGTAHISINSFYGSNASCLYIQPDDKIVVGGNTKSGGLVMAVARLNANGSTDSSFGENGVQTIDFTQEYVLEEINRVAVQSNGKIIIAGEFYQFNNQSIIALARFTSKGKLDSSFGTNGKIIQHIFAGSARANALAILPTDKILIAGSADSGNVYASNKYSFLMRYSKDGKPDSSFGKNSLVILNADNFHSGKPYNYFESVAVDIAIHSSGKIVTAGSAWTPGETGFGLWDFATMRFFQDGRLDSSFGINGIARSSKTNQDAHLGTSVKIMADGNIVAAGFGGTTVFKRDFSLVCYKSSGIADRTFGKKGVIRTDMGSDADAAAGMAVQDDNKIILAGEMLDTIGPGERYNVALVRYNYDAPVLRNSISGNIAQVNKTVTIKCYPNPVKDILHIQGLETNSKIMITNNSGEKIKQLFAAGSSYDYNIQTLPAGVYYISTTIGSRIQTIRFIKQ